MGEEQRGVTLYLYTIGTGVNAHANCNRGPFFTYHRLLYMDEIRVLKGLISLSSRFCTYTYVYVYVQNIYIEMVYKVIPVNISPRVTKTEEIFQRLVNTKTTI